MKIPLKNPMEKGGVFFKNKVFRLKVIPKEKG